MNNQRRIMLKGSLAASALGVAVGAGLLTPRAVLAAWPEAAFKAKDAAGAMTALTGLDQMSESADIRIKAPVIAVNNPAPLIASFELGEGAIGFVSTRIKMGKSGDVIAVVKAGGKLQSAKKEVKVTIGGCGG